MSSRYDVSIGGVYFNLASAQDLPESIETIPIRKDQQDVESEPGEQSLTSWWRRSQESFHEGAGNLYAEPRPTLEVALFKAALPSNGFYDSHGIDVWERGQISLLRSMSSMDSKTLTLMRAINGVGNTYRLSAVGSTGLYASTGPGSAFTLSYTIPAASQPCYDGFIAGEGSAQYFYTVDLGRTLNVGLTGNWSVLRSYQLNGTSTCQHIFWAKGRMWGFGYSNIWQPDTSINAASGTIYQPIYSNPNQAWKYTCAAEGPSAVYFGGHDGHSSAIQLITVGNDGSIPTLSGAQTTAMLPEGELLHQIAVLSGQYIGIGTSKGFRVGTIDAGTGNITYGPILFQPTGATVCTGIATMDHFFLVSFNNTPEVWRVDPTVELDNGGGVYPYARDVEPGSGGYVTGIAVANVSGTDQIITTTNSGGIYYQSTSTLVTSGWLQSGRIRYRTNDLKLFKYINVQCEPSSATADVSVALGKAAFVSVGSTPANQTTTGPLAIDTSVMGPQTYLTVKLTLTRSSTTVGPTITSYTVKALPSVAPQRMITLPLLLFDKQTDNHGVMIGGHGGQAGWSMSQLSTLQSKEDLGDIIQYVDYRTFPNPTYNVVIDSMKFVQTAPGKGRGGILLVQLRTVAA